MLNGNKHMKWEHKRDKTEQVEKQIQKGKRLRERERNWERKCSCYSCLVFVWYSNKRNRGILWMIVSHSRNFKQSSILLGMVSSTHSIVHLQKQYNKNMVKI